MDENPVNPMDDLVINPEHIKQLWFALFGITHAIEQLGFSDQVDQLVESNTGMGAFMFARATLAVSVERGEE